MKSLIAFTKKEMIAQLRSAKLYILLGVFFVCGLLNPIATKLTPLLLELMSETLAESGMNITLIEVSAIDSWTEFFANMPVALIVFIVLQGSIFTREYKSGTLILSLTKGLDRYKVVISKSVVLLFVWTVCYLVGFAITYIFNAIWWDNSIVQSLGFATVSWWLFGVLVIALIVFFSTLSKGNALVLLGTGGVILLSYILGLFIKLKKYVPTFLTNGSYLVYGVNDVQMYVASLIITIGMIIACFAAGFVLFNKKSF